MNSTLRSKFEVMFDTQGEILSRQLDIQGSDSDDGAHSYAGSR